ncbi:MAG: glycosyltransferase family 4 protein [Mariprofundaceae bacterium]
MSSLRVLVVTDVSAETVHGGAERMLHHHLRALTEAGMEVTVLTKQPAADAPAVVELPVGVTEHRLDYNGDRGLVGLRQIRRGARLWWKEQRHAFDVVIAEQPFVMWALLRAGCRLPRLQVCYSFAFEEYATRHGLDWNWKHRLITSAMRHLEAGVYNSAIHMLVLSDYTRHRLKEVFGRGSEVSVVYGAADMPDVIDAVTRGYLRARYGWEGPVIVTLRNLVPRTGVDLLVQSTAMLRYQYPDLRWCVIGSGPLLEPLQNLAAELGVAEQIEFTGFLPEAEVYKRLQAADLFMLPTRALEGFGLVTVEANVCGLPVVATPVGANSEVVTSVPHNRLARDASPEALAEAVKAALADMNTVDMEHMREEIRQTVLSRYGWVMHDRGFRRCIEALVD